MGLTEFEDEFYVRLLAASKKGTGLLKKIIKIIVMTASKVKSQSSNINVSKGTTTTVVDEIKQEIKEALNEIDDWEW